MSRNPPAKVPEGLQRPRYSIVRFDPFHEPRTPNTERPRQPKRVLPADFPLVVDLKNEEIVEPVLLHLHDKFFKSGAVRKGVWTKRQSADNAAEDLRLWWQYLHDVGRCWNGITDSTLATYFSILTEEISETTKDFLAASTIRGRRSSLKAFYDFAGRRLGLNNPPSVENAVLLSRSHPNARRAAILDEDAGSHPHPMSREAVDLIAEHLGPLPSKWMGVGKKSSNARLAFELGLNVGLRVDEIENLRVHMFEHAVFASDDEDVPLYLKITKTKGLVKRTVQLPRWLADEIRVYLDRATGEREASLKQARKTWMKAHHKAPSNLLLTEPRGSTAGKVFRRKQIEADFGEAIRTLGLVDPRIAAEGTDDEHAVNMPRHVFHDCRHTYAYWEYRNFLDLGAEEGVRIVGGVYDAAVRHVQRLLGHKSPEVTKSVYLDVFEQVSTQITAILQRKFREIRESRREGMR